MARKDMTERVKMLKAMEFICRQVNNEDCFTSWAYCGVADGDIYYGDLDSGPEDVENVGDYCEDDEDFARLMHLFLRVMESAASDGGLYCNGVCSRDCLPE